MKTKAIFRDFQIHNVPFEKLIINYSNWVSDKEPIGLSVSLDDVNGKRWQLNFKNYAAMKATLVDYIDCSADDDFDEYCYRDDYFHRHILEVVDSEWIKETKQACMRNMKNVDDIENLKHFILPLYEQYLEILADEIMITPIE